MKRKYIYRCGKRLTIPNYNEEYKIITYPTVKENKYAISNYGNIFNLKTHKIMKSYLDKDFHERITLVSVTGKSKHYFIHRLMLWEFIGPAPDNLHNICNHKDGIPYNNMIHNLEWCSVLENTNHAKSIGLMNNVGLNSTSSKYDEKLIRKICKLFESGYNNIDIYEIITGNKNYKENGTGLYQLINKLGKRIVYPDIVRDYDYYPDDEYFKCDKNIQKIRDMIINGKTNYDILQAFGIEEISDNRKFYRRIMLERKRCNVIIQRLSKV